jgi:glucose 1-dehydrogenase
VTGRLAGEVAIVTGSTSGLGREIARVFASEGAAVVITGRRADAGEVLASELAGADGTVIFVAADLQVEPERARLVEAAQHRLGPVSILVNNAVSPDAIAHDGRVTDTDDELWLDMLSLVVVAAAGLARLVIPGMVDAGRGSIVNITAKSAALARPGLAAYSSAKAALDAMSRSIAADHSRSGVRCNTVQPGYILHERRDAGMAAERRAQLEAAQLTRLATPTDVAMAVLFLASREAEVITGVTLPVDGGSTAVRGATL